MDEESKLNRARKWFNWAEARYTYVINNTAGEVSKYLQTKNALPLPEKFNNILLDLTEIGIDANYVLLRVMSHGNYHFLLGGSDSDSTGHPIDIVEIYYDKINYLWETKYKNGNDITRDLWMQFVLTYSGELR